VGLNDFNMKAKCFFRILLPTVLLNAICVSTQDNQIERIDTGRIQGAMYRIIIPADWNHNLVMYAHGYEMPSMPSDPKMFHSIRNDMIVRPFLDRGFAVARSTYHKKGWALAEGVDDNELLRQYFFQKYGKPDTCYITGHSMGGGITLATLENFPQYYQGAMPMCPLSGHPYLQVKLAFDIDATFAVLFPSVLPSLADVTSGKAPAVSYPAVQAAVSKDTVLASAFALRYELKLSDVAMVVVFCDGVLRDICQLAGGNPFDNTNTLYSGFPDNLEMNRMVERLKPTPGIRDVFGKYDRTGEIDRPTLLLHTIYDQLISPSMAVIPFDNMVHEKGKADNLVVVYTNGQGHCQFTAEETGKAFDLLRKWVSADIKPVPGILQ
jgi:pimeloyl-ACP methyl ester carboxylesterase